MFFGFGNLVTGSGCSIVFDFMPKVFVSSMIFLIMFDFAWWALK